MLVKLDHVHCNVVYCTLLYQTLKSVHCVMLLSNILKKGDSSKVTYFTNDKCGVTDR